MDQNARPTFSDRPVVVWELTRACRLNCAHCTAGPNPQRSPSELSTYEAYKTIDQIVALQPQEMIMTGGDPLERSDVYQLVDYAVRRGARPTLTLSPTPLLNGSVMTKLRRHGLTRIAIALEASSPDMHDAIRGLPGQFTSTLLAIRWARMADMEVEINTLASPENIDDIPNLVRLLVSLGVKRWNVYFPVPVRSSKDIRSLSLEDAEFVFQQILKLGKDAPFAIRTFEAPLQQDNVVFIGHTGEVAYSPFDPQRAGNVRYRPLSTFYSAAAH